MPAVVLPSSDPLPAAAPQAHAWLRLGARCLLVLLAANALFLGIRFADNLVPKATVRAALSASFATGALTTNSYPRERLAGWDQGSDCIAAQLAVLGGEDAVHDAIAPRVLSAPQVGADLRAPPAEVCRELKDYLDGRIAVVPDFTYTRFWQGGASLLAAALTVLPLDGYRALLLNLTLGLIALTAVLAALADRRLLVALAPLLVASFALAGQVGYGQLISHAPAHVALWLIAALLVARRESLTPERLAPVAVAAGAVEAFLDQIISVPLIAGSFLIVAGLVLASVRPTGPRQTARDLTLLAAAWGLGFAGSYAIKLLISVALLGSGPWRDFAHQLAYRVGTADPELGLTAGRVSRAEMLWRNLVQLAASTWRLGYWAEAGSTFLNRLLAAMMLIGWGAALHGWWTAGQRERGAILAAGLPYLAAAALVLFWIAALPEHTYRHAFMVRSFLLMLLGGWGWYYARELNPSGRARPTTP